jgi:hypothetical protein
MRFDPEILLCIYTILLGMLYSLPYHMAERGDPIIHLSCTPDKKSVARCSTQKVDSPFWENFSVSGVWVVDTCAPGFVK